MKYEKYIEGGQIVKMMITISAGNQISQLSLIRQTNKFFGINSYFLSKKIITSKNENYTFEIKHKSIIITLSNKSNNKDYNLIKRYIEILFKNKTIGIFSKKDVLWLNDIKNVKIYKYYM